jgi:hypothetical protein
MRQLFVEGSRRFWPIEAVLRGQAAGRRGAAVLAAAAFLCAASPGSAYGGVPARTVACTPVHVAEGGAPLPDPWRAALDALVQATAVEGLPWSCPGGSVALSVDEGGATLTVVDARGRTVTRRVPSPDQVVATGEAILAAPPGEPPPPAAPPAPAPEPAPEVTVREFKPPTIVTQVGVKEPRLYAEALLGVRGSGPGATAWGSAQLRGILPLGAWLLGFWARYDFPFRGPPDPPPGFEMDAVSAGFAFGRRLLAQPFELRLTIDPSMAVVMQEAGMEDKPHPEGAKVAFRLGTTLSGSFRIASIFRGVVMIDGEFAPAAITGLSKIQSTLPPVPAYTAGLLLGIEAVIR